MQAFCNTHRDFYMEKTGYSVLVAHLRIPDGVLCDIS